MRLKRLQKHWDAFGEQDPLWAILTRPDKKGNRWDRNEFFRSGALEVEGVMAYAASLGVRLRRRSALDFGCGVGRLTAALAAHFEEVVGVDIAPSMIRRAREWTTNERCRFVLNETDDLRPFEDGRFDLVYTNIVLQHIPTRHVRRYLGEFVRVLAGGGLLIFQLPAGPRPTGGAASLKARLKSRLPAPVRAAWDTLRRRGEFPRMDMHVMPPDEVKQVVDKAGARVLDIVPDQSAGPSWLGYRYCVTR